MTQIRLKNLLRNKFKVKNVLYIECIMILKKHFKTSNNFKKHQWLRYFLYRTSGAKLIYFRI